VCWATIVALVPAASALAGGTPENALIVVNPDKPVSLYIGHYYAAARNVPPENIVYFNPHAGNGFDEFKDVKVPMFYGAMVNHDIEDHIDYVLVAPNKQYRIDAAGLVADPCVIPMTRVSQSSLYGLSRIVDEIASETLTALEINRFFTDTFEARGFDASTTYQNGAPSESPSARRYFIAAMIGYDGDRGNTPQELTDMIDRSIAVDGTFPTGTIYFVETTDPARSPPRHHLYPGLVSQIAALGGSAVHLTPVPSDDLNVVADGTSDSLGIMSGWPTPDIMGADITLMPGAFCDHLTSYAATFSNPFQTKVSAWINQGASASVGAVDEPCAVAGMPGKFPNPNIYSFYLQGSTIGEAWFRATEWIPLHMALYGDPLTRPFAHIPDVTVAIPSKPVSGTIGLSPTASTSHPTATIDQFELLLDGVSHGLINDGETFSLDTSLLEDGHHDLRVLAYDNTLLRSVGRSIGTLIVDNNGYSASLSADASSGDPATPFTFTVDGAGGSISEIHLLQGKRIVGATAGPGTIMLYGRNIGPGPVRLHAKVFFDDGKTARSAPLQVDVAYSEDPAPGSAPQAFAHTIQVRRDQPTIIALPASHNYDYDDVSYSEQVLPTQSTVEPSEGDSYRLIFPNENAIGTDTLRYKVNSPAGGNAADITIVYGGPVVNDDCSQALLALTGSYAFTTRDATTDGPDEASACGNDLESDIWYRAFSPCNGVLKLTLSDLDYPATLAVYEGLSCPTEAGAIACIQAPGETEIDLPVSVGAPFRIRIGGPGGVKGSGTLTLECQSCPADCAPEGGDGTVDTVDLLAMLGAWGTNGGPCDISGDGVVDVQDLLLMLGGWGDCK
jgi:uncharacterized protein (TIGR03790 family)